MRERALLRGEPVFQHTVVRPPCPAAGGWLPLNAGYKHATPAALARELAILGRMEQSRYGSAGSPEFPKLNEREGEILGVVFGDGFGKLLQSFGGGREKRTSSQEVPAAAGVGEGAG